MNTKKLISSALGVVLLSSFAQATDVFDFTTQSLNAVDAFGDVDNQTVDGPLAASNYLLAPSCVVNSLTLTEIATATYGSEFQVRIFFAAAPTLYAQLQPTATTSYVGSLTVAANTTRTLTGPLLLGNIVSGSQWRMEIADTFNDGTAGLSEQTATDFKFTLSAVVPPIQTWTISGDTYDAVGDSSNPVIALGTYSGATYTLGSEVRISGGTVTKVDSAGSAATAVVVLRNSANPYYRLVVAPTTSSGTAGVPQAATNRSIFLGTLLTPTVSPASYSYDLYGATIPTGSTWTAELAETTENGTDAIEATISGVTISVTDGTFVIPTGTAPATTIDLGDINSTTAPVATPLSSQQAPLALGEVRWFKFTTAGFNQAGKFLDIFVDQGSNITDPQNPILATDDEDTELGLFDSNGLLIANDDDNSAQLWSQLSFGDANAPRGTVADPFGTLIGVPQDGRNGDGLAPGTYYLAAARWSGLTTFYHGFAVGTSTTAGAHWWKLNLQTNVAGGGGGSASISGNLELLSTVGSGGTESIGWTLSDGTNTYNGNVSVADVGSSAYSIAIPSGAPNGNYTLKFKGGTFLSKTLNVTLTGSSLTGQDAALKNGDIDQDTEVGPGDFEAVVAQFGAPGDADVDNDGEVGPSDFETVVANFGLGDE
jgi:hypothetical protein